MKNRPFIVLSEIVSIAVRPLLFIKNVFIPDRKYREIRVFDNNDYYKDKKTEAITLDNPNNIHILTTTSTNPNKVKKHFKKNGKTLI